MKNQGSFSFSESKNPKQSAPVGLLFYIYKYKPRKEIGMKNKLRKMLSLVLSVVIAMSAISLNTFAATILDIKDGSTNKLYVDWYSYSYNFNGRLKQAHTDR